MLKSVGIMGILFACTMFGYVKASYFAKRPQHIRQFIVALQRIETEIVYAQTPLQEAFLHVSAQVSEPFAEMFQVMSSRLQTHQGTPLCEIWKQSLQACWQHAALKKSEFEIAVQLGHVLGVSDYQDQVKHLRLAISQLQAEESEARQEQQKYESMWRSLGLLMGALIVILMY